MKTGLSFLIAIILISFLSFTGLFIGSFSIDHSSAFDALFNYDPENKLHYVLVNLRLPRILLALVTGAGLSFSGYLIQAMVNNPLADPYTLGTASGAAVGANIVFFGFLPFAWAGVYLPPVFAFIGAVLVTLLIIFISYEKGTILPVKLLLTGIAITSLNGAIISLLTYMTESEGSLRTIVFWIMGSFDKANWGMLPLPIISVLSGGVIFHFLYKQVNILMLGEKRAENLGVNVVKIRWVILLVTCFITGSLVSIAGPVGFIGLMVPHLVRGIYGVNNRFNLWYAILYGGAFMLACDLLARIIYPPAGLPIGIITSFLGIPFFVYLLYKKNYKFNQS